MLRGGLAWLALVGLALFSMGQICIPQPDADGDGTPDSSDLCPNDPGKIAPGTCGCGVADTDTDGDGTPDCNDGCDNDANKIAAGVCGCGVADTDTDSDGTLDCNDACDNDANKTAAGVCGCGVADTDTDGDGTADCNETLAVTANAPATVTGGAAATLTALSTGGTAPVSYAWQLTASGTAGSVTLTNATSQTATATFSNDANGTFTFQVTATDSTVVGGANQATGTASIAATPGGSPTALTLTPLTDTIPGTDGDDTIDGSRALENGNLLMTLNNADSITGGLGTDTLDAEWDLAADLTPTLLAGLEVLDLDMVGAAGAARIFNANSADALTTVNIRNYGAGFLLTVQNIATALTNVGLWTSTGDVTITVDDQALTGAANALSLALSGMTDAGATPVITIQPDIAAGGYETLNIASNGSAANGIQQITDGLGTTLTTVNISGSANLTIGAAFDATVTTVNGGTATGKLDVTLPASNTAVTGGTGDDTFRFGANFTAADTVNGGTAGVDTLSANSASIVGTVAAQTNVTNIDTIACADALGGNLNVTHWLATNATIEAAGWDDTANRTITMPTNSTLTIKGDPTNAGGSTLIVAISANTTADVLNVVLDGGDLNDAGANDNFQALLHETINLESKTAANTVAGTFTMGATAQTELLKITGTQNMTFTGVVTADQIDASGLSGILTLTAGAAAQISITGGSGADLLQGSAAADTIIGGAGDDVLNGLAGADTLTGGDGKDNFRFELSATSDTVTAWVDGQDILVISSGDADFNDSAADAAAGLSAAGGIATALAPTAVNNAVIYELAANGTVAIGTNQMIKLSTPTANAGDDQTTFNAAIGTGTVTGIGVGKDYLVAWYDTTNGQMVVAEVDAGDNTATQIETADAVSVIVKITMTAADYAAFTKADIIFADL